MNWRTILWIIGVVMAAVAVAQVPALILAVARGEPWLPFAIPIGAAFALLAAVMWPLRGSEHNLDHRSGFLAVTAAWVAGCAVGAAPFALHPTLDMTAIDAFFESASGFSTTGATVLSGLDTREWSVLLWRSITQWLGGLGMVLLGVAVFPILGLGGMQLYKAEAPGPTKDKLTPRIAETAKILWVLYVGVTVANIVLLWLGGMTLFDAVCHAFSTVSTGGFSTHDASLAHYDSSWIHLTTSLFMLLGGTSFAVLHRMMIGGVSWSGSPELRAYLGIFTVIALLVALDLRFDRADEYPTLAAAFEHSIFQTASILTTTGFATRDFDLWPDFSRSMIFVLVFVGGMAGSTAGGVKVVRVVLALRLAFSQFFRLVHPHGVRAIKLGEQSVDDRIVFGVVSFLGMWIILILVGTALLSLLGSDMFTSFSAAAVSLGNIGPGFGGVGPSYTFASFSQTAKAVLAALMILGRLEIYTVLVILTAGFWRQ